MINLNDVLNCEPMKVSRKFEDYTNLIYGPSKIGKSSLNAELHRKDGYFIFAEPRYRHLSGIKMSAVNSWSEFMQICAIFKKNKKQLQEIYPVIVISGVENLLQWSKEYTLSYFGVKEFKDVAYGAAYSYHKDMWNKYIQMLSNEGYRVSWELHSTVETIKLPTKGLLPSELKDVETKYDKTTGEQYVEFEKIVPDMKPKFLNSILNNTDNILYVGYTQTADGKEKRCIHLRGSLYYEAGITFEGDIPEVIELNPQVLKETFESAINGYENTIEEEVKVEKVPFEDIIKEIGELGKGLCQEGKRDELTATIEEFLGVGAKISEAKEEQYEQCSLVLAKLKGLM